MLNRQNIDKSSFSCLVVFIILLFPNRVQYKNIITINIMGLTASIFFLPRQGQGRGDIYIEKQELKERSEMLSLVGGVVV